MAELERQAEHMVEVESRAEVAEGERDAALDRMQLMTPRPALPPSIELPNTLGPEGAAKFLAALNKFRWGWEPCLMHACLPQAVKSTG
jgi:hypothetical protein